MSKTKPDLNALSPETRLVAAGRDYAEHGFVNPAVYHGSTVLFPDTHALHDRSQTYVYGRRGTPTSRAVEEAVALVEGGHNAKMAPSGLAAISTALLAFLKAGDHLLMVDTVYNPARQLCDGLLKGLGIETSYYDPLIGRAIASLIRPNTRVVYAESPGSQTMEVQDIPAIAEAAHKAGALLMVDNTWGAGHYFKAFDHGADISIQAATKYLVGHSDAMMGTVTCTRETWEPFKDAYEQMGQFAGPDDMYLTLRGIHTLDVRLERHMKNAVSVAEWLRGRAEVETVLYPALSNAPGHELWKRDFRGATGLFSIVLKPCPEKAVAAFLDRLSLFGMGYSWGGFESLAIPFKPHRTATTWTPEGYGIRFHIGLENMDDLKADLAEGFSALNASS
ncbi:cystathionine beta-lyase [Aestuariivirga sp.]|uniref:cystathionine beta-lyase n=1 Tax=Aestuariivirga sp. TaxID=2650926 RepID=UPI003BA845B0